MGDIRSQGQLIGASVIAAVLCAALLHAGWNILVKIHAARAARRTTVLALCTACVIATYTLIDGAGVRRSGAPAGYTMWIFAVAAVLLLALSWRREGQALLAFARRRPAILLGGGAMSAGSYGIALWAMTGAPVALVAALRETSILFATAIAILVLRERIGPLRLLAVGLIAAGAAAMRLA